MNQADNTDRDAKANSFSEYLTEREKEILRLTSEGLHNKEIAASLCISFETVKKHLQNIFSKLNVSNRIEALNKVKL